MDEQAPIQASAKMYINAPIERVWELLINLPAWPAIDPSVCDVQLEEGIEMDTFFSFKLNNFPIRAKFAVIDPCRDTFETPITLERSVLRPCLSTDIYDPVSI